MQSRMLCLVVGVLSLVLSGLAGAQDYQWTEIVIPGATVFRAAGLNDKCQTAVTTTDGRTGIYRDGTFTPLPPPPQGLQVAAWGINNNGVITGSASTVADGTSGQGFILRGSTYMFFSRPGWDNTTARAIADSGLITGQSFNADGSNAGFIYDRDTGFTDATPPGSTRTITMGMNRFGRITGSGQEPGIGRYGFVWQQRTITEGKRELRPFLARLKIEVDNTSTEGINDSGVVVGFTSNPDGPNDGFVGNDARGYQRLVPPGGEMPGNFTFCQGINNFDQVVCGVTDSAINPLGAFIGSPSKGEGCFGNGA